MKLPIFSCVFLLAGGFASLASISSPVLLAQSDPARQVKMQSAVQPIAQPANSQATLVAQNAEKPGKVAGGEEEDPESVYRHSQSVQTIGHWLHVDEKEHAAKAFQFFNFALLAGAVLYFLFKKMPGLLRGRREQIQKQLVEARAATEDANARLKAIEEKLSRLDQDIASIRKQAEVEAAGEEARIKASIETERQRIVASAEQEIAAASSAARRALKRYVAELAVDRAANMISLNTEDDRSLLRQFGERLGTESRNGGHS